ncbi:ribosomal RNA processing protein 1 homolog A [Fukomys damarensis]|uniref:Ribosomal RNA processing protein 1 like protein A n=1 Tax=Fukomys damarensis TaxID=885580 RepID=A0A091DAJ2_FUKDA|nr:ribosomal RNA processing protein 1 homolog A [Fukomys damarensis]KFO28097.1 Ribosomal RNA processing protein 1 like protein A [Fukomys damarensis]
MAPGVQLPPEIQLAQRLAGNEQVTRDRAVRKLRKYIVARSQRATGGFTHDELLKIWKGLFYCMWMQDKLLLQEELGRTISQLIHAFQTMEAQHLFLRTFWQTMIREWAGLDRLRLDKFYLLMRLVLNEALKAVRMRGWEERDIEQLMALLTTEILHEDSQAPNGVKSHFLEVFLEELAKVGAAELTADQNLWFVEPFCQIAALTKDTLVLHNITRGIFEAIVEQAPFAIEDLMKELDAQEGEDEASDSDGDSGSDKELPHLRLPAGFLEQEGHDEDSSGPVLQFDYEAVANRLFEVASQQNTPSQNRKRLYKVVRKLQDLAGGHFPEDEVPERACKRLLQGRRVRKAKRRWLQQQARGQRGEAEQEEDGALSPGGERKKSRRGPRRAGPMPHTGAAGRKGTHRRKRRPGQPRGARGKAAGTQESARKKKRPPESG